MKRVLLLISILCLIGCTKEESFASKWAGDWYAPESFVKESQMVRAGWGTLLFTDQGFCSADLKFLPAYDTNKQQTLSYSKSGNKIKFTESLYGSGNIGILSDNETTLTIKGNYNGKDCYWEFHKQ